jgi:outer membrane protein TolC
MRRLISLFLVGAAVAAGAPQLAGQDTLRLSLNDALALATASHPSAVQARAEQQGREADRVGSTAAWLPRLTAEWGAVRSNDPVAVFGTRLRQGIFGPADFAIDALNFPAPITDFSTVLTLEQPLLQPEAIYGRRAAGEGVRAAVLATERVEQVVAFDAIRAYYAVRLADERVSVLQDALEAGRQTLAQVTKLRAEGQVTVVDEQLARARVAELEAALSSARAGRVAAGDQLLELLGKSPGAVVLATDTLTIPATESSDSTERKDLAALAAGVAAQDATVSRGKSQWIPSIGAFGNLAWHQGDFGLASGPSRWTAGLMVRWTPFKGMADVGQLRRAEADREAARARLEAADRHAQTEVHMARAEREAALLAYAASEDALIQATQASRAAQSRYGEGVATISELLSVRAAESGQRLARLQAIYQARVADAALVLALGGTPR